MQSIIFITLSVIIMGFVLFLGVKAIQKGLNAKNNKEFNQEKSDELNNSISEELEKLNKLFEPEIEFALNAAEDVTDEKMELKDVYKVNSKIKYPATKNYSEKRFIDAISDAFIIMPIFKFFGILRLLIKLSFV